MPEAKTAAEKLQMRGEEVTLDSLKNFSVSDDTKTQAKNLFEKILQVFVVFTMFVVTLGLIITLMVGMFAGFAIIPLIRARSNSPSLERTVRRLVQMRGILMSHRA